MVAKHTFVINRLLNLLLEKIRENLPAVLYTVES